jgi:P4 family phage/plasmid primase-like protien
MMIQQACASLNVVPTTSILNSAYRYIMERPELAGRDIVFDAHGLIIADDATIDPQTGELGKHSPDHYALFKVAAPASGERECPAWLSFLQGAFSDRPDAEATEIMLTLQEWFGASLIANKSRAMKLGLLAHGPSRTGKTQIAKVARGLLGVRHVANPRMRDLEGRFGMEPFLGKRGWIADDAIGEGEYLDADTYKVVVTGEETSVQCKGGRNVETSFGFPVMLTANNLPRVKDQSDAVYNRSLILPCTHVRPESEPEPAGYDSIAEKVVAEELTGILWWAFEGWQRLRSRGYFSPPKTMTEAKKGFEADNNPVGTWLEECLEFDLDTKVSRNDLLASMNGWNSQEYGVDAKPWSGRGFFPRLFKMIPGYSKASETTDENGVRHLIGVKLGAAGLTGWRAFKDSRWGDGSKTSDAEDLVNKRHYASVPEASPMDRTPRF